MDERTDRQPALPIDDLHARFVDALAGGHVVVTAATGSGKSTRLPAWAAARGRVLVVEPRRVAASSLAHWLAETAGGTVGEETGYAIRLEARYGPDTRVVFATPGIALQWLARDGLAGFATVVLDEFHERRADVDLLLALLRARDAHRLVVTSATIDAARIADTLGATRLDSEGRSYPVEVRHVARGPRDMPAAKGLAERVADAVGTALAATDGDVLAFLPGRGEIEAARKALGDTGATVVPLHGGSDASQQREALHPGATRRVILATNVAETSVTVPGVTAVVDGGLERRTQRRNGRTVLALQPIALDSAEQRRGRAGRTQPGICIRLWGSQAPLAGVTPPEVQREDLTDLALGAACAGEPLRGLAFPDPLPDEALAVAERRLERMGAVDGSGRATAQGRRLFDLPVDATLAHLVWAMPDPPAGAFMADLAGALSVRGRLVRLPTEAHERSEVVDALGRACDATLLVAAMRGTAPEGVRVSGPERREARRLAERIRSLAG